jgi:L-malate glycosyltransferase
MSFVHPNKKRIALMQPSFAEHDAMSDYLKIWNDVLERAGYITQIFTTFFPQNLSHIIKPGSKFRDKDFDLVIYFHGIGDKIVEKIMDIDIPLLLYYQNITPAEYYREYNWDIYELLVEGRVQLKELAVHADLAVGASEYNVQELKETNYKKFDLIPVFFDEKKYANMPKDKRVMEFLKKDDFVNITFLGRFAPNKAQTNLVKAFYLYHKHYNPKSRLNLVGRVSEMKYFLEVRDLINKLGISEFVNIPGTVSDAQMRSYYEGSDVFVSLSEHEGFFVPVLECNYFKTPIIAYKAGAVPYTLGDAGLLLETNKPEFCAEAINEVLTNEGLKDQMIKNGEVNYQRFEQNIHESKILKTVAELLNPN